jgi:hypothetical protein
LSGSKPRCRGEPNDRFRSKECLSAGGGALDEHDYLRRLAETMVALSASRERLKKRARGNDAQLSWRQRRGDGSPGVGCRVTTAALLKLLSVRVKAASDPAWPIIFDPGLGSFYAGKPVKLLLRAVRPCHNDETDAGLRWKNFEGGLMFDCCHFHNFSNHPTN